MGAGGRHGARRLLLQALYQSQVGGHDVEQLIEQFSESDAFADIDRDYFVNLLTEITADTESLETRIAAAADRPVEQLDPIELSILLIGVHELESRIDIPYKVVINEGVNLARRFGAVDSHKYINACLDAAAQSLREVEVQANAGG